MLSYRPNMHNDIKGKMDYKGEMEAFEIKSKVIKIRQL